jgi:hypothetical protein
LGRSKAPEEELGQLWSVARSVIMEVLRPHPGSSVLAADLSEIPGKVTVLVTDSVFHVSLGVLTLVASH